MSSNVGVTIVPAEQTTVLTIVRFEIYQVIIDLFKRAIILVNLFAENNNLVKNTSIVIENEEYNNWGSDDHYLVDLVCSKLGFTKVVPPVEENPPA
jgi:hypothetical protein